MARLTGSLVLYNSNPAEFEVAIQSFLDAPLEGVLVVSDNSPVPLVSMLFAHPRVIYIHNDANLGFGKAHNKAFSRIADLSDLHLLLNPDIRFESIVLPYLVSLLESDPCVGAVMPQIQYEDGGLQRLCKLLPSPADLIFRRFFSRSAAFAERNRYYELHDLPQSEACGVPSLSGCFLLVRSALFARLGGFDERFFMYMEDVDLVRRMGDHTMTLYDPTVSVVHLYQKGSYVNPKLLGYHIRSAVRYFNKWGWLFDGERTVRNRAMIDRLTNR